MEKKIVRNQSIDVLKGIAIIFVILTHFDHWRDGTRLTWLFPFYITMAVPIFIIISGYVNAKFYLKHDTGSVRALYNPYLIIKKCIRYTAPFVVVFLIEQVYLILQGEGSRLTIIYLILFFIKGGVGKGSYYYPILMQFIFLFPIIYILVKKYKAGAVVGFGVLNLAYEVLQSSFGMHEAIYRLLIFRYLFVISLGCYAAVMGEMKRIGAWIAMSFAGFLYILSVRYLGVTPLFTTQWSGTCLWACMFIAPIVIYIIKKDCVRCRLLEILGKASYNIFFAQMIYYYIFAQYVYAISDNMIIQLVLSVLFCILGGILFYQVETPVTNKIILVLDQVFHRRSTIKKE